MTNNKDHVVNQMATLLKNNPRDEAAFFEQEKNYKWFEALVPYDFFKPETVKSRVTDGDSYYFPAWPQGVYIETIAKQIHENEIVDTRFIELFLGVLRTFYVTKDNLWAIRAIFKSLFLIPTKHLSAEDVSKAFKMIKDLTNSNSFIEFDVHDGFFSILKTCEDNSHDHSIFREYIKYLLSSKSEESFGIRERKLIYFRDQRFNQFSDKFLKIVKSSNNSILEDIISVVTSLLDEHLKKDDIDQTTTIWRPAIESHQQNQFKDSAPSIYSATLYELSKILMSNGHVPSELLTWKNSDKNTFSRIYFALVNAFPTILDKDECSERILKLGLRHQFRYEVYHFLAKQFDLLSTTNQINILNAINSLTDEYTDENDPKKPLFTAWKKMRWLQAIKSSKNEEAKKLYNEVYKVTNGESDHPDFDSYMSSVKWGFDSPISLEEFDLLKPNEIIQKISEFKDKKDRFGGALTDGLSRIFEDYIFKEPVKCSALIKDMLGLPATYASSLFSGYTKCWLENKITPVEELLDLALQAFNNESFCEELVDINSRARWAANSIFRFISAGVRNDEKAFDPAFNTKCYAILKMAAQLIKSDETYKGSSDAVTRAINEPRGVLFELAILLALRQARLCYEKSNNTIKDEAEFKKAWIGLFEIIKEPLESKDEKEVSLHAHFGALYRQFLFLNNEWLYKNLELICPDPDEKPNLWSAFMQGYCYVSVYVKEMYTFLNSKGYLLKFLRFEDDGHSGTRINTLQEHILSLAMISVLLQDESLENSLLIEILEANNDEEWNRVIRLFSRIVGNDPEEKIFFQARKIVSFFLDKFDTIQDKELWKKHYEGVGWLLEIFKDPNDLLVERIVKIAAYYSNEHWDHYEIVEYLYPHKDSHSEVVGNLFYELIKNGKGLPAYPEEKITAICSSLKKNKKKEILATICRVYSDKYPTSKLTKEICGLL